MDIKKSKSLRSFFLKYFFTTILVLCSITLLSFGVFLFSLQKEIILPANAVERAIQNIEPKIKNMEVFDPKIIPYGAKYLLLSKDQEILQSNMNEKEKAEALSIGNGKPLTGNKYYKIIPRKEGQCILQYQLRPRFQNDTIHQMIPNLEIFTLLIYISLLLLGILTTSIYYAKTFNKELIPILEASKKISNQDLEFTIRPTKIKELNHILQSMSDMKVALKTSLTKQWEEEQLKKEQIAALAHDIKTPLTIIRGNVEILQEKSSEKDEEYIFYALKNINRVEEYVEKLHEIAYMEKENTPNLETWGTNEFIQELLHLSTILGKEKEIQIKYEEEALPKKLKIDREWIIRGIMNLVTNAIEHSPEKGTLWFHVSSTKEYISITLEDEGPGFSQEDLKFGKNQFYQGDKSRTSHSHVGLGLYIVNQIMESHNGSLDLENSTTTNGAKVTITLPLS